MPNEHLNVERKQNNNSLEKSVKRNLKKYNCKHSQIRPIVWILDFSQIVTNFSTLRTGRIKMESKTSRPLVEMCSGSNCVILHLQCLSIKIIICASFS